MKRTRTLLITAGSKRTGEILAIWVCLGILIFSSAQAQGAIIIGMGDSIGEGVQSADASLRTQRFSYLTFLAQQMGIRFPLPFIRSSPIGSVGDTIFRCRLWPDVPALNLSVAGANADSLLNDRADALDEDEIDSETDLVLFPRVGSQMEIAESIGTSFVVCWVGNNDVLSAAISFDQLDASQMTPVEDFRAAFMEIAERLDDLGGMVVFANIPDVTKIGFLVDRQNLIRFLGSDYGLAEGDYTSIVVMLLIRLGLDDGSLLKDPDFVLDTDEVKLIQERIEIFNRIIQAAADRIFMPVVDIHALFDDADENPPTFFGIPVTARFLGGIFSLDGVHPSNIGHGLVANAFIQTINSRFQANIPLISDKELHRVFLRDPFQDKDGDGRVMGRFGAGLLETLGPLLGISGDKNDFFPNAFPTGISAISGKRFIQRYLILRGKDPRVDSEWTKWDALEAFRDIYRLNVFEGSEQWRNRTLR